MRRRSFLIAAAAIVAAAVVATLSRLLRREVPAQAPEPARPAPASIFPARTQPVLFAVADVIVPRYGEHPAASEIDLVPQLERWVRAAPRRRRFYQREWENFEARIRRSVPFAGDRPEPEALIPLFEGWYDDFRTQADPDTHVRLFEQLRRDVLRVYYASPAGWASVGYAGPVMRAHPRGESLP
jgi:hypothetical protein